MVEIPLTEEDITNQKTLIMDSTIIIEKSVIIVAVFALTMMAMYSTWAERCRLASRSCNQMSGPFGLFQPLADGFKIILERRI
jgi:NADH-quinone oxidoreductase subunit H